MHALYLGGEAVETIHRLMQCVRREKDSMQKRGRRMQRREDAESMSVVTPCSSSVTVQYNNGDTKAVTVTGKRVRADGAVRPARPSDIQAGRWYMQYCLGKRDAVPLDTKGRHSQCWATHIESSKSLEIPKRPY